MISELPHTYTHSFSLAWIWDKIHVPTMDDIIPRIATNMRSHLSYRTINTSSCSRGLKLDYCNVINPHTPNSLSVHWQLRTIRRDHRSVSGTKPACKEQIINQAEVTYIHGIMKQQLYGHIKYTTHITHSSPMLQLNTLYLDPAHTKITISQFIVLATFPKIRL